MKAKNKSSRSEKLRLNRETLRNLEHRDLERVAAGAPTNAPTCADPSIHSRCASCLCPI